jgi:predicted ATP-grasp superfamily ATP-dependent carboligase
MKHCAVILGNFVNAYSTIQELYSNGLRDIVLFSYGFGIANLSNKIIWNINIRKDYTSILKALERVHKVYDYIIPFSSDDFQIEALYMISVHIKHYCFLPFNPKNVMQVGDKAYQYQCCEKLQIPYPITRNVRNIEDYESLETFIFPIIIKPIKSWNFSNGIFRALEIKSLNDLEKERGNIVKQINQGVSFIASELIPGHTNGTIVSYMGYRSHNGIILNEWIGRKLAQYPNDYGVFSSASNQCDSVIVNYGQKILNEMNLFGIIEVEFKYDERDRNYKLMEISLRSTMWHRIGYLSGVNIQYSQWLDAIGSPVLKQKQNRDKDIHFCYYKYEILNLLSRRDYKNIYKYNLKSGDETYFAIKDVTDIKPYLLDKIVTFIRIIVLLLTKLLRL